MISSSLKNSILALTLSALITGTDAADSCNTSSPQCCWVVRSWQLMGKSTKVSSTSATACCSMAGVTCDSTNKVTAIKWIRKKLKGGLPSTLRNLLNLKTLDLENNKLSGSLPTWIGELINLKTLIVTDNSLNNVIPTSIGQLKNLVYLRLSLNSFSGPLPSSIGNLTNLKEFWLGTNQVSGPIPNTILNLANLDTLSLRYNKFSGNVPKQLGNLLNLKHLYLNDNPNLGSYLSVKCGLDLEFQGTKINVCGCPSKTPAYRFPNPAPPIECLGNSGQSNSTIRKRTFTYSTSTTTYSFTCNKDASGNPYQDCINLITFFCNPNRKPEEGPFDKDKCKQAVDSVFNMLNIVWRNYRVSCGNGLWQFTTSQTITWPPVVCSSAAVNLKTKTIFYILNEFLSWKAVPIESGLLDSADFYLWKNSKLQG